MTKNNYLKIGQLATETGLSVGTLRYYSDLGLLQPVTRGSNNYRYYSLATTEQVNFIKKARTLGFTLEEIKQIIDVRDRGETPCNLVKNLLDRKIEQLDRQIEQMTIFKAELEEYQERWSDRTYVSTKFEFQEVCPLIATISLKK